MTDTIRLDHRIIFDLVQDGSKILDLGCGAGELMGLLADRKHAVVQGIEIDETMIYSCVEKGLSVFHGDIDNGLSEYADKSFDYVILNQSFQQVRRPDAVLKDALRVGRKVIVAFPNFAYYRARFRMFFRGRTPITQSLPYEWFDTPNIHFLSILDFKEYCLRRTVTVEREFYIDGKKTVRFFPNLLALVGIFLISDGRSGG